MMTFKDYATGHIIEYKENDTFIIHLRANNRQKEVYLKGGIKELDDMLIKYHNLKAPKNTYKYFSQQSYGEEGHTDIYKHKGYSTDALIKDMRATRQRGKRKVEVFHIMIHSLPKGLIEAIEPHELLELGVPARHSKSNLVKLLLSHFYGKGYEARKEIVKDGLEKYNYFLEGKVNKIEEDLM